MLQKQTVVQRMDSLTSTGEASEEQQNPITDYIQKWMQPASLLFCGFEFDTLAIIIITIIIIILL